MHDALDHLARKIDAAVSAVTALLDEAEKQAEHEGKRLEEVAEGERFDDGAATSQAEVVEALQRAVERLETAEDSLVRARDALREVRQD